MRDDAVHPTGTSVLPEQDHLVPGTGHALRGLAYAYVVLIAGLIIFVPAGTICVLILWPVSLPLLIVSFRGVVLGVRRQRVDGFAHVAGTAAFEAALCIFFSNAPHGGLEVRYQARLVSASLLFVALAIALCIVGYRRDGKIVRREIDATYDWQINAKAEQQER